MMTYPNPTTIHQFFDTLPSAPLSFLTTSHDVQIALKRLDLSHPQISGNKWYKLHHNLVRATEEGHQKILTFGGAYSNHIVAVAKAGELFGFETIGVIRGEEHQPLNPVLQFAKNCGMHLKYMSRTAYRQKHTSEINNGLKKQFGDFYLIPEGGSNLSALRGCRQILTHEEVLHFDYICLPVGTGGTLTGVLFSEGIQDEQVIGFSALKGGSFLRTEIEKLGNAFAKKYGLTLPDWQLETDYHFGGFAKSSTALRRFIQNFETTQKVKLDPIYTGKMLFGILDKIEQGDFLSGTKILALHTGGIPIVETHE